MRQDTHYRGNPGPFPWCHVAFITRRVDVEFISMWIWKDEFFFAANTWPEDDYRSHHVVWGDKREVSSHNEWRLNKSHHPTSSYAKPTQRNPAGTSVRINQESVCVCVCVCVCERERERKEWTVNKPNINKELIEVILKNDKRKIDKNGGLTEKK